MLPVACKNRLAKAWRRSWHRNGTPARRATKAKLLAKHVYRFPSPCQKTYCEAMCLGVPTSVPMAVSLNCLFRRPVL